MRSYLIIYCIKITNMQTIVVAVGEKTETMSELALETQNLNHN